MLRGTTWTSQIDRAAKFETAELAAAALEKAKPFMKPALRKKPIIQQVASGAA